MACPRSGSADEESDEEPEPVRRGHEEPTITASTPGAPGPGALPQLLLREGLVTEEDLARAAAEQHRHGRPLGRVLIEMELLSEATLVSVVARQLGLEFVDLNERQIDAMATATVPTALCRRHGVLPIAFDEDGRIVLAMSDPANVLALDDVRTVTDRDVSVVVAARTDVMEAIERFARMGETVEDVGVELGGDEEEVPAVGVVESAADAPIVRFVNAVIAQAVTDRASDIHIEPGERNIRVRYRVDGVLHEVTTQSRRILPGVVSRLKIMSEMDIAERRVPQDGRMSVRIADRSVDLRVSTLPTVHGEKVVLRILDKSAIMLELSDLGFLPDNYKRYQESFRKPYGMILATGPTGSGKSTTLYATLNAIASPEINIVTTEDPVEYRLHGINQVQINNRAGLTFPSALRSILRQDPDVVLVGEMRDTETARIGMEAALTGHLVLSTLHTNDAPSAATRLREMGIDPFLVGSAIECVVAQRLARRLCKQCREPYTPSPEQLATAGLTWERDRDMPTLYRSVGCGQCGGTGYRGRLAIHEVMQVTEEVERLIVERAATDDIAALAMRQGMRPLREDGLEKVLAGHTTLEEIARVIV